MTARDTMNPPLAGASGPFRLGRRGFLGGTLAAALAGARPGLAAEPRDGTRVYFFGNSLIHHLTDSDATTVPYWLAAFARQDGTDFRADGRWGFPRNFAAELPPKAEWSIHLLRRVTALGRPINAASYDSVVLVPENFVQDRPADRNYAGDNPERQSPLTATLAVLDWVRQSNPDARFLIYEGWADMHPFSRSFPPGAVALREYAEYAREPYHDWFLDFTAMLQEARPDQAIGLIPVGRVLADLLAEPELAGLPATALYSDLSPHGTATIYLLAAMITYAALFDRPPPAGFAPGDGVAPEVVQHWARIADRVWAAHSAAARG